MSGGELDYAYYTIDRVIEELENYSTTEYDYDLGVNKISFPLSNKYTKKLIKHLKHVSFVFHSIEWAMSGDTAFEKCNEDIKEFVTKRIK